MSCDPLHLAFKFDPSKTSPSPRCDRLHLSVWWRSRSPAQLAPVKFPIQRCVVQCSCVFTVLLKVLSSQLPVTSYQFPKFIQINKMKSCCQLVLFYVVLNLSKGLTEDLLELNCNVNSDCSHVKGPDYNTTCLDGRCLCNNLNGETIPCKPKVNKLNNLIGGTCPCPQSNAECNRQQSICYCKEQFVPSSDRRRCMKMNLVLGEDCEDSSQCLGLDRFAECHSEKKQCWCQKNFIARSGMCISVVDLSIRCFDNQQCLNHTVNSMCYNNTCTCVEGFTASDDNECLPFADYKESCKDDNQCKHKLGVGSECHSGLCTCDYKHFANQADEIDDKKRYICERKIIRGDYCRDHNDCYQYHLQSNQQSMECYFSECNCRKGYLNVNEECTKNAATPPKEVSCRPIILLSLFISVFLLKIN